MTINSEDRLLLACARTELTPEHIAQIKTLAKENLDWPVLIDNAAQQRVIPLLYYHLNDLCREAVPAAVMADLQDQYYVHVLRSNLLAQELLNLLTIFAENGIKVLPFKGATLAVVAYGDLDLRQFGDLDLFICEQDINRVKLILGDQDYQPVFTASWEMHLDRRDGLVGVDVHWAISRLRFAFPLYLDELWERRVAIMLQGEPVDTLSAADLLLIRCENAARDYRKQVWPQLQHICDVAELIRANPQLDWGELLQRARKLRAKGSLFLYLALAIDLLGVDIPDSVHKEIEADPQIADLARLARQRLVPECGKDSPTDDMKLLRRHLFSLRLKEFVPLPPAPAYKLFYTLAGIYYWPSGHLLSRLRYWLGDRKPRTS